MRKGIIFLSGALLIALNGCVSSGTKDPYGLAFERLANEYRSIYQSTGRPYTQQQEDADLKVLTSRPQISFLKQKLENNQEPYSQEAAMNILYKVDKATLTQELPVVISHGALLLSLSAVPYLGKLDSDSSTVALCNVIKYDGRPRVVRFAVITGGTLSDLHKKAISLAVAYRIRVNKLNLQGGKALTDMLVKSARQAGIKL